MAFGRFLWGHCAFNEMLDYLPKMTKSIVLALLASYLGTSRAFAEKGFLDQFQQAIVAQNSTNEPSAEQLGQNGHQAITDKEYTKAIEFFEAAAKIDPSTPHPPLGQCFAQILLKNYSAARASYKLALELQPEDVGVGQMLLWYFKERVGDLAPAKRFIDEAIKAEPRNREFQLLLAEYYEKVGDTSGVLAVSEKIDREAPGSADSYYLHASVAIQAEKPGIAAEAIEKALTVDPNHHRTKTLAKVKQVYARQLRDMGDGSPMWKFVVGIAVVLVGGLFLLAKLLNLVASRKDAGDGLRMLHAKTQKWAVLLAFILAIPTVALCVGKALQRKYNTTLRTALADSDIDKEKLAAISLDLVCANEKMRSDGDMAGLCSQYQLLGTISTASISTMILGPLLLLSITIAGQLARVNRGVLLAVFLPGLYLTVLAVMVLTAVNAALAIASIWFGESALVGRVHIGIIATIGIGALVAVIGIVGAAAGALKKARTVAVGKLLSKEKHPALWDFVKEMVKKTGTTLPKQIVAGLEPNFYVTEAEVVCLDGKLSGRTMYISLPVCRILSPSELRAVIAHELGHYKGSDTYFSTLFYPIYRGAANSIQALTGAHQVGSSAALTLLPTQIMLSHFLEAFATAETSIGRERELAADKVAALHENEKAIATALIKLHAVTPAWDATCELMKEALGQDKMLINASSMFMSIAEKMDPEKAFASLADTCLSHPTDTHPPLSTRLKALKLSLADAAPKSLTLPHNNSAIHLFSSCEELEKELSEATQVLMSQKRAPTT